RRVLFRSWPVPAATDRPMMSPSMINDGHVHLGMPAPGHGRMPDAATLLARMDRHGVSRAAVITPASCGWDNEITLAAVHGHPNRFVGLARIDTERATAADHCTVLLDQGMCGIRIDLRGDAAVVGRPSTNAVLAELARRRAVLDLHANGEEMPTIARLADRYRNLTVLVDHGGRPDPAVLA